jgi:multidrug resistance efflux pump
LIEEKLMRRIALLAVVLAIAAGFHRARPGWIRKLWAPGAGPTTSTKPTVQTPNHRIFAGGTVEGSRRETPLQFEISGRLKSVHVHEGDWVEMGDVLAELDPESFELRIREAEARLKVACSERDRLMNGASQESRTVLKSDVAAAEVLVREAESQLARARQLAHRNAISTQEQDEFRYKYEKVAAQLQAIRARWEEVEAPVRQDDLNVAQAKVALAEAVVRQEQNTLEKTRLRSPISGIVLNVAAEAGELVGPSDDRHFVTVVNRDVTHIRAYVEEIDALSVKAGQKAVVTADGEPGKLFEGTVQSCSPHVRPKWFRLHKPGELTDLRVREVVIELPHGDDLVVGLPVEVFIDRHDPVAGRFAVPGDNAVRPATAQAAKKPFHKSAEANHAASDRQPAHQSHVVPDVSPVRQPTLTGR